MAKKKKEEVREPKLNPGVEKAIEVAGNQLKLAEMMGVTQPAVNHWLYEYCPPDRAKQIEIQTGVPREEICPETFS